MSDNQINSFGHSKSFRRKFSWKRSKRTTQSVKVFSKGGNTGYKPKLTTSNTLTTKSETKFNVATEGTVTVHQLVNARADTNFFIKLLQYSKSTKLWEAHNISLNDNDMSSKVPTAIFPYPIPYTSIVQLSPVELKKDAVVFCVKITTACLSMLIRASNTHQRDRWLHSIRWKKEVCKYRQNLAANANNPDILLRDFKELVKVTLDSPLDVDDTHKVLLDVATSLLVKKAESMNQATHEALILTLAPLLQKNKPSPEICNFFTTHCRQCPRSILVVEIFTPVIQQILKNVGDFGKSTWLRVLVMEYIQALRSQNDGLVAVQNFVHAMHGPLSQCPHKRILINLITVCNSAIYQCISQDKSTKKQTKATKNRRSRILSPPISTEKKATTVLNNCNPTQQLDLRNMKNVHQETSHQEKKSNTANEEKKILNDSAQQKGDPNLKESYPTSEKRLSLVVSEERISSLSEEQLMTMTTFVEVLREISRIPGWRAGLADVLQPLPFPEEAMNNLQFTRLMYAVVERFAEDDRESVVRCLLYTRGGKDGWLQIYSPGGSACEDDGKLFTKMMKALMKPGVQTGKMKKFLTSIAETQLQVIIMLALRENVVMISVLRDMLELGILTDEQTQLQVVSALRCTHAGKVAYTEVRALLESLNDAGGPTEFILSPNSTDEDLRTLLQDGTCGSLVSLTLASTNVTSRSCKLIAGLRNLKRLNLWATNFDDYGLCALCDCLDLEHLNLCETLVTNEGIQCLEAMPSLRYLNLNSTDLNQRTFLNLKKNLPNLVHCDIEYTECSCSFY